jgi:hypothetical protein
MTKRDLGKHYFREWRAFRELSLAKAVSRMEAEPGGNPLITGMSLSRIERGLQPYSEEVVNALADIYRCEPYELFTVNPLKQGDVVDLMRYMRGMQNADAGKALRILKSAFGD